MAQYHPRSNGHYNTYNHRYRESPRTVFESVDEVHAERRRYECWQHHDYRHRREGTHHRVHVVVDDARIGVHRRLQDVGIDICRLPGLVHLDVHIFYKVSVELVDLQLEFQLLQQILVATD